MMKITKTTVLSILALGGIAAAGYFYMKSKKSSSPEGGVMGRVDSPAEEEEELAVIENDGNFPLEEGSRGEEVRMLQKYLNNSKSCAAKEPPPNPNARMMAFLPLEEDGIFGRRTAYVLNTCYKTGVVNKSTYIKMIDKLERTGKA